MRNTLIKILAAAACARSAGAETHGIAARVQVDDRDTTAGQRIVNAIGEFFTGQRFRFTIWSGREGFLYVVALRSQGGGQVLFPTSAREPNHVERDEVRQAPEVGWYRFDQHPGDERVFVLVTPQPAPELDEAAQQGGEASPDLLRFCLSKYAGGKFEELLLVHNPKS